jgi:hypothetical protein
VGCEKGGRLEESLDKGIPSKGGEGSVAPFVAWMVWGFSSQCLRTGLTSAAPPALGMSAVKSSTMLDLL